MGLMHTSQIYIIGIMFAAMFIFVGMFSTNVNASVAMYVDDSSSFDYIVAGCALSTAGFICFAMRRNWFLGSSKEDESARLLL